MLNPSLNINKTAGSTLGYKHSNTTKNSLSLVTRNGIMVKVINQDNIVTNIFPTIISAAKHYNLDPLTLSKYIKQGYFRNNLRFEAELKDLRVWVFDKQRNIIDVFPTANKAANFCGIHHSILHRYLKSGKLLKNKKNFFFKD